MVIVYTKNSNKIALSLYNGSRNCCVFVDHIVHTLSIVWVATFTVNYDRKFSNNTDFTKQSQPETNISKPTGWMKQEDGYYFICFYSLVLGQDCINCAPKMCKFLIQVSTVELLFCNLYSFMYLTTENKQS